MTLERLTPTADQEEVAQRIASEFTNSAQLAAGLGWGKTLVGIRVCELRQAKRILVVGPLHTRYGWQQTFDRQGYPQSFRFIANGRKDEKAALADFESGEDGIYFVGREFFRLKDWSHAPRVDMLIWDESHVLAARGFGAAKNRKGLKALGTMKREFTLFQSGTPWGSAFEGAWAVTRALWPDEVDISYWRWVETWCEIAYDHFAPMHKKIVGELNPGSYAQSLPCYIYREAQNTHEPVFEDVYVDLSPAERRLYEQMEADSLAWLQDQPMVAELPIVRRIRLRQLTLGVASINEDDEVFFPEDTKSTKLDTLQQILSDLGDEKVLITTDSSRFARIVAKRIGAFAWIGDASQKVREAAKQEFVNGDLKYIVAHPAAIAEGTDGLNLASHIMVVLSETDNPVLREQLLGRLNRQGQKKQVVVIRVRARNSVDDPQAQSLLAKELAIRASVAVQPAA